MKEGVCLFEETSVRSSNAASGDSRPRQERRDRRGGNKKGAGTCECRGTTEVMMGRPSPQQEPVSGVIPPPPVTVLEPRYHMAVCVTRSVAVVWWWGQQKTGEEAAVGVCLGEIRKTEQHRGVT